MLKVFVHSYVYIPHADPDSICWMNECGPTLVRVDKVLQYLNTFCRYSVVGLIIIYMSGLV